MGINFHFTKIDFRFLAWFYKACSFNKRANDCSKEFSNVFLRLEALQSWLPKRRESSLFSLFFSKQGERGQRGGVGHAGAQGAPVSLLPWCTTLAKKKWPLRLCIKSKHCSDDAISAWSGDWHGGDGRGWPWLRASLHTEAQSSLIFRYPMIGTVFWFYA